MNIVAFPSPEEDEVASKPPRVTLPANWMIGSQVEPTIVIGRCLLPLYQRLRQRSRKPPTV
jgi:hypothetical protein